MFPIWELWNNQCVWHKWYWPFPIKLLTSIYLKNFCCSIYYWLFWLPKWLLFYYLRYDMLLLIVNITENWTESGFAIPWKPYRTRATANTTGWVCFHITQIRPIDSYNIHALAHASICYSKIKRYYMPVLTQCYYIIMWGYVVFVF